jgi:hypothetical protein
VRLLAHAYRGSAARPLYLKLGGQRRTFRLPQGDTVAEVVLEFEPPQPSRWLEIGGMVPVSPFELGLSEDQRRLGIALHWLAIEPGKGKPQADDKKWKSILCLARTRDL